MHHCICLWEVRMVSGDAVLTLNILCTVKLASVHACLIIPNTPSSIREKALCICFVCCSLH
jgi:hypothetical protein